MQSYQIRPETAADGAAIETVTRAAFETAPHASGTEAGIPQALRDSGALSLSLVAEAEGAVVGHVAFSPVQIGGQTCDWFGLGPVSVAPARQRQGIGVALITEGLEVLRARGARGCVVLGDPGYYQRFGFRQLPELVFPDVPAEYFMALQFSGALPRGEVRYDAAFDGA